MGGSDIEKQGWCTSFPDSPVSRLIDWFVPTQTKEFNEEFMVILAEKYKALAKRQFFLDGIKFTLI